MGLGLGLSSQGVIVVGNGGWGNGGWGNAGWSNDYGYGYDSYSPYSTYYYPPNYYQPNGGWARRTWVTRSDPARVLPNNGGTYPYDGGPINPVPLPRVNPTPAPIRKPAATVPLDGTLVSAPNTKQALETFAYPAYGEKPIKRTKTKDQIAEKR